MVTANELNEQAKAAEKMTNNDLVMLGYVANLLGLPVRLGADKLPVPPTKKQAIDFLTGYIDKVGKAASQTLKDLVERARKG